MLKKLASVRGILSILLLLSIVLKVALTTPRSSDAFKITVPKLVEDGSEKITLKGYSALSSELSQAKYDLAGLLLQKANKEFG